MSLPLSYVPSYDDQILMDEQEKKLQLPPYRFASPLCPFFSACEEIGISQTKSTSETITVQFGLMSLYRSHRQI